jgi:hypothetical protein
MPGDEIPASLVDGVGFLVNPANNSLRSITTRGSITPDSNSLAMA